MRRPRHCRHCHAALAGVDVFALDTPSYAAVLRGHDAASLRALLGALEARHRAGVSEWCPHCARLSVSVFALLGAGAPPAGPAVAEHVLALRERAVLLELAPHACFGSSSRNGSR
jgi:glutaredoxin